MDVVTKPLHALDAAFQAQSSQGALSSASHFDGPSALLPHLLQKDALAQIPVLQCPTKSWNVLPGSLVRFVGMVQDMLEPEYFSSSVQLVNKATGETKVVTGKYRDLRSSPYPGFEIAEEVEGTLSCRHVLYCVPVPAETQWAMRAREQVDVLGRDKVAEEENVSTDSGSKSRKKRGHREVVSANDAGLSADEESDGDEDSDGDAGSDSEHDSNSGTSKTPPRRVRARGEQDSATPSTHSSSDEVRTFVHPRHELNLPIPTDTRHPCIVKLYDIPDGTFKLNDVVEFVGILSRPDIPGIQFTQSRESAVAADPAKAARAMMDPFAPLFDENQPAFGMQNQVHAQAIRTVHFASECHSLPFNIPASLPIRHRHWTVTVYPVFTR